MTIKDLFINEKFYIVGCKLNEDYYIYLELLDEYGGASFDNDFKFDENYNYKLCVEICDTKERESICDLNDLNLDLECGIEYLKNNALKRLKGVL